MKKISVYIKGNRNSTAYYRIYQYFDRMAEHRVDYHTMMSDAFHDRYMPISRQPLHIKVRAWLHIYCRMLTALLSDLRHRPDILVIHKRIISRFTPPSYNLLLRAIRHRGTRIIWDFDDHIIANHEVTPRQFLRYARLADVITVTHEFLQQLVPQPCREKTHLLPTTDGDMYTRYAADPSIRQERLRTLSTTARLVWVGTSTNLPFVDDVLPLLDAAAQALQQQDGRTMQLEVVCDKPLTPSQPLQYLSLDNTPWTRPASIHAMQQAHVGIMPLPDTLFTQGKGAFKLVQYLSIALPVAGSAVGYNKQVITPRCGRLVGSDGNWTSALLTLLEPNTWTTMSEEAYKHWTSHFSYDDNLQTWRKLINA